MKSGDDTAFNPNRSLVPDWISLDGSKQKRESDMNGSGKTLTRVRVARLPTAKLFFCCHKCHSPRKNGQIIAENSVKRMKKNALFDTFLTELRSTRITLLLIFVRCLLQSIDNQ